ncbi:MULTISPECIES: Ger(x)C family spore germination protein [Bacillus]|uniref:Ger(x)C family spore germination protein n=1 Tax=Bacillus TaxID=1386 RepID=UPI00057BE0D0|nr:MULTISPECIES: Ger(x)C family spore germination protein [Bacillus]PJY99252.1 Ger(x)C family spore germination protein [Bacillus vallismortis]
MMRRCGLVMIMLLSLSMVPGCWDKQELTDLAIISAIGIDRTNDGKYLVHFQIINPGNVAGGLQGGGTGDRPPVSVYSMSGDNLAEALRKGAQKVSRRLYFAHTSLIVLSENLAKKEGLYAVLDNIDRDTEIRSTSTLVIAHETKAENIVKTLTPIDKIPSNKVNKTLKFANSQYGGTIKTSIQEVIQCLAAKTKTPVIPGYVIVGDSKKGVSMENTQATDPNTILKANGLAVFDENGRLKYWIEGDTSVGAVWLKNKVKQTYVNADWKGVNPAVSFQVIRQKTKLSPKMENGKLKFDVKISAEGTIDAVNYPFHLSDPKVLLQLERLVGKQIEKDMNKTVKEIQDKKVDFVGFGEKVLRTYPDYWKKVESEWNEQTFANIPIHVNADVFIRRTGLRNDPLRYQIKQ